VSGLYRYLDQREAREKAGRYPLAAGLARPLPPPPRLQNYPFYDLKAFRGDENRVLEHYGWVDKNAGVVRIPVERAIDVLGGEGPAVSDGLRQPSRWCPSGRRRGPRSLNARAATDTMTRVSTFILIATLALGVGAAQAQDLGPAPGERVSTAVPPAGQMPELLQEVGLDQKLNTQVPLDLSSRTRTGAW
jgi:hypothetical protein